MRICRPFISALLLAATALSLLMPACAASLPQPRGIVIITEDGFRLSATQFGKGERGVVIAHDAGGSREDWAWFAEHLAGKGFHVLTVNNRGYPGSDGARDPAVMDRDLRGGARYLTVSGGVKSVAFLGAGVGGSIAIQAGAGDPPSASVVAISPATEYETLNVTKAAERLFQPKLVAFGDGDKARSEQIERLFQKMPPPKTYVPRPGELNGAGLVETDPELQSMIVDFLRANS